MALTQAQATMVLGPRQNSARMIFGIPAGKAGEDPGLICLEGINSAGDTYNRLYLWADSSNQLRYHTSIPTDEDSDGSVLATSASSAQTNRYLSNLLTTAINTNLIPDTTLTSDLGSATYYWDYTYSRYLYLNSTAILSGASAGVIGVTGTMNHGVNGTGTDVVFYGDTSDLYMWWDQNASTNGALIFNGATATPELQFVQTNSTYTLEAASDILVLTATDHANSKFMIGVAGGTNGVDFQWIGATSGANFTCDAGTDTVRFDDVTVSLRKTSTDVLDITMDTNATYFDAGTANDTLHIGNTTALDVRFHGANTYDAHWDASADTLALLDNAVLGFGNTGAAPDITIKWDATDLLVDGAAANTAIKIGATNNQDLFIYAATATNYVQFDTDDTANTAIWAGYKCRFNDSTALSFGTSADIAATYNGGTNVLALTQAASGTGSMTYGADGKGIDQTWYVETASSYIKLDQANDRLLAYIAKIDIGNATVTYDFALSTNSLVLSCTDNAGAKLILGTTGTNGLDIDIVGAGANQTIAWDAGNGTLTFGSAAFLVTTNSANGRGFTLPVKTDAGAPGTTGTANGAIVFNTNDNKFYVKVTAGWISSAALT